MHRIVATAAVCFFALLASLSLASPVNAAVAPPSLVGEQLTSIDGNAVPGSNFQVTCNDDGTGTVTYEVTGTATGPYPGPFVETGTLTWAPATGALGKSDIASFEASFAIDSAVGLVEGTKTLLPNPNPMTENSGFCDAYPESIARSSLFSAGTRWEATITTANAVYYDSGWGTCTHTSSPSRTGATATT